MNNKVAFVSGATSGIGKAIAQHLHALHFDLLICGRRTERLEQLTQELNAIRPNSCKAYTLDVRNSEAVNKVFEQISLTHSSIAVLVNNAGLAAGLDSVQDGSLNDWDQMLDTNVKGLLYVTKAAIPLLRKADNAQIINISSIAGKEIYAKGNVYCASKHAVDALSRAMRIDLLHDGIRVSSVSPGLVNTEFSLVRFKGDEAKADQVYHNIKPLSADDIADAVDMIVTSPSHVNYADLVVLPSIQASARDVKR